jgi:hypothetical protein
MAFVAIRGLAPSYGLSLVCRQQLRGGLCFCAGLSRAVLPRLQRFPLLSDHEARHEATRYRALTSILYCRIIFRTSRDSSLLRTSPQCVLGRALISLKFSTVTVTSISAVITAAEATEEPKVSFRVTPIPPSRPTGSPGSGASAMCTHFACTPLAD